MSSTTESGGSIAPAVLLSASVAFGAGWALWQTGKLAVKAGDLLIEANRTADMMIEQTKRRNERMEQLRQMAVEDAVRELDADLERVRQQHGMAEASYGNDRARLLSAADLMDELAIAMDAVRIRSDNVEDVVAPDSETLERSGLNEEFSDICDMINEALKTLEFISETYGLSKSETTWFHSCFDDIDEISRSLCSEGSSNEQMKAGIRRLKVLLEDYRRYAPSIEDDIRRKAALYEVYVEAAGALAENVRTIREFDDADAVEEELRRLQQRAEKAAECAKICATLGPEAYICYAWEQELSAMGYEVRSRKEIADMAGAVPSPAQAGGRKIPFYRWGDSELTQLYSLGSSCSLQVIVHNDGTVTMKTIADHPREDAVKIQRAHCANMRKFHERLRENWFISYDHEEKTPADAVTTVSEWRSSAGNIWAASSAYDEDDRRHSRDEEAKTRYAK